MSSKRVEVGIWVGEDDAPGFSSGRHWANVGSKENAAKLLDLTPDEMAALAEYGNIEKDVNGGTITIEAGWF